MLAVSEATCAGIGDRVAFWNGVEGGKGATARPTG
jgi:hypothetical protein